MKLKKKDLHVPFTGESDNVPTLVKVGAMIMAQSDKQHTAVDATTLLWVATQDCDIRDLYVFAGTACASGESMTFDVKKNGTTILSGVLTVDSTSTPRTKASMMSLVGANTHLSEGDVLTVVRDYTAGGGPTPLVDTQVVLEAF